MAKYRYRAKDKQGNIIDGMMSAYDEDDLYRKLKNEDKFLIEANSGSEGQNNRQLSASMLSEFNRELGDMLAAGVTMVRALTILAQEEYRRPREQAVLLQVLKLIRQGESISDAMEQQNGAFPVLMVNMYRAAETGGRISDTAKRLAVHYEKEHRLNTRVQAATIYPSILLVLMCLVVAFIMTFVLPQLSGLFDKLEELPVATRILFAVSSGVQMHWRGILAGIIVLVIVFVLLGRMPVIKMWKDQAKLKLPVIGRLMRIIYTARFARSLSSLYSAGIPIVTAMQISSKTIGNTYIERQFDAAIARLVSGSPLSEALEEITGFRQKLSAVVRVGEESGELVQMLDSMADSFDYESEMAINQLVSYLEPVLIVVMAFLIGFIMIAVMMPIYDSYSAIGASTYY